MKAFALTCIMMLSALLGYAQEVLSFKGIPVEGSVKSFGEQLVEKGFSKISEEEGKPIFYGDFTGTSAVVMLTPDADGSTLNSVVVALNPSKEWRVLASSYTYYKQIYTDKYGEPFESIETTPAGSDSNTAQMLALSDGKANYKTTWVNPHGIIALSIIKADEPMQGMITICYFNRQTLDSQMQNDLDEI